MRIYQVWSKGEGDVAGPYLETSDEQEAKNALWDFSEHWRSVGVTVRDVPDITASRPWRVDPQSRQVDMSSTCSAAPIPPVDRSSRCTTSGKPIDEHTTEIGPSGQQKDYVILCDDERAKGFVRPVRRAYKHVGISGPKFPLRDLTGEEMERHSSVKYVKFEPYPKSESPQTGRFWTQEQIDKIGKGCGTVTTMGQAIAETYARDPHFYGATFCVGCGKHLPVGESGEFVWLDDGSRVGT